MRILIMGTGGVGGYYGGLLAQRGHEVTFIAHGAHFKCDPAGGPESQKCARGLHNFSCAGNRKSGDAEEVELILFCVKAYDTDEAARSIRSALGPRTVLMSLQNGIEAAERIGKVVGSEHVIGGVTWLSSAVEAPGVIRQVSQFRRIALGELEGGLSKRIESISEAFKNTGITVEASEDIRKVLWTKLVFITAISSLGSLTRLSLGDYRSIPETRSVLARIMKEVEAVARAQGTNLDGDVVENWLEFIDASAGQIKPSMQLDIEAGHRTELESMVGVVSRKGRELGIPTPAVDFVYACLLPVELKARNNH